MRRRTEELEQRNSELHDALEKLRRAQDELVRSEKLASMGRLVAGIAHEINNPVNAVVNTLGPLEEAITAMAAEATATAARARRRRGAGDAARRAARRRAHARRSSRRCTTTRAATRSACASSTLARSVDDTLDLLRHRLRNIRVEKEIDPELRVHGFAGQINQVFMNLLTNAAQAIGDASSGGTIRIDAAAQADDVVVTVADNGPGIPPDVLPRSSIRSSRRRTSARGRASASRSCTASSSATAGASMVESQRRRRGRRSGS